MKTGSDLELIKEIGELSGSGLFVCQRGTGSLIYSNRSLLNHFGLLISPDIPMMHDKVIPEDRRYLETVYHRLLDQRAVESVEFRVGSNGQVKTLSCNAYLIGEVILGVIRDLTKVREHETYITSYGAKKDAILEMVSHNLSGPLNISHQILLSLEKVISNYADKEVNKHLQLIRESMNHCIDVINDFLIEEHLTSEQVSVRKTRFDVVEKVNNTLERLRKSFAEKAFNLSMTSDPLFLNSDEVKFFQVFHNLVLNSVKFTPPDGRIDVELKSTGDRFYMIVRDNGIGIPDALKGFIFQKYSPASRPGLKDERSIGMGLYIVQKLTRLMGGEVSFDSTENVGTTFTVTLPME